MKRRGFTIVELLMVVGIISVLITISVTAINGSIRAARVQRAEALCTLVGQAITAYYAQKGEWPFTVQEQPDKDIYTLTADEVRKAIKTVVMEIKNNNPLIDVSGLFVSRDSRDPAEETCSHGKRYYPAKGAYGMDFMQAIRGSKHSETKMKLSEMSFGYPHPENGQFMRFIIRYSYVSDSITVEQWHWCED